MTFMFSELNTMNRQGRLERYFAQPQSLEEVLLYYLSAICPAAIYCELADIVGSIENEARRDKMEALLSGASAIRRDGVCYAYDDSGVENVWVVSAYEVKPPTERLGGLYSDDKLGTVLSGMRNNTKLPPMKLKPLAGGAFDYEVVDGIHRYYASIKLGHGKLPAFIDGL